EFFLDFRHEGGLRHRFLQWGNNVAEGHLIFCLHAASLCSGVWAPVASRLAPESVVVACDLRGHGESDAPEESAQYSWHVFGEDFIRMVRSISKLYGRCPTACVTHSFAGDTALIGLAARPSKMKLLMLDPVLADAEGATTGAQRLAKGTRRLGEKEIAGFDSQEAVGEGLERVLRAALARPSLHPEAKAAFAAFGSYNDNGRWRLLCRRENEAEVYANRIALVDYLSAREVPVEVQLVLASKRRAKPEDQESALLRDRQQADRVVAHCLPGSSVHPAEGVGHFLVLEDPAFVAKMVRNLVSQS
ncbi:MGLL, partial [Symbiodinium pilosum]